MACPSGRVLLSTAIVTTIPDSAFSGVPFLQPAQGLPKVSVLTPAPRAGLPIDHPGVEETQAVRGG